MRRAPIRRAIRRGAAVLLSFPFAVTPAWAAEDVVDEAARVYDLAVLRPAGLVQTVLGAALFAPSYPLALLGETASVLLDEDAPALGEGVTRELGRVLVGDPYEYTFERELGDV